MTEDGATDGVEDAQFVEIDADELDAALEDLEAAMKAGEAAYKHDDIRPSTVTLANRVREAYRTMVRAHPDYELKEGDNAD